MGLLFMHCLYTVHALKNIKNSSHDTIHTFKNYFAIVLSVFSFQFQQQYLNLSLAMPPAPLASPTHIVIDVSMDGAMVGLGGAMAPPNFF